MKRILTLLLFIPFLLNAQIGNSNQGISNTIGNGGVGFVSQGGGETWAESMFASYLSINDHITFTEAQQDTILKILSNPYVINTFGEDGLGKTTCDFFLYFETSNKTTNLSTRTETKTGETLRWIKDTISANAISQNNLPATTCSNGWLAVTSTDGFDGWTTFDINTNTFTLCPAIHWATPTIIYAHINSLTSFKTYSTWTSLARLYLHSNYANLNINIPAYSTWTTMQYLFWYSDAMTGTIPLIGQNAAVTLYYRMQTNDFTSSTLTTFRKGLIELNLQANDFSIAEVNALLAAMDAWYVGANLMTQNCTVTLDGVGMGAPTGGDLNTNIVSLIAKATGAGKTWAFVINY